MIKMMVEKTTRRKGRHPIELMKGKCAYNKTKYFRLRLTDKVSSERPKRDLRET